MPIVVEQIEKFFTDHPDLQKKAKMYVGAFKLLANSYEDRLIPWSVAEMVLGNLAPMFMKVRLENFEYDRLLLAYGAEAINRSRQFKYHYQRLRYIKRRKKTS